MAKTEQIAVRFENDLLQKVRKLAEKESRSIGYIIRLAVAKFFGVKND